MISIFIEMLPSSLILSLIMAILALGIMIPFRLLKLADLSSEGSYPLGAVICAVLINQGLNPIYAISIAIFIGGLLGISTALLHIRFKIDTLLAAIIIVTMTYSLNLRIMGKPNLALYDLDILFNNLSDDFKVIILLINFSIIAALLIGFLYSEKGLRLIVTGLNRESAKTYNVNEVGYIILGFFIANCFNAFAGSLMVILQGYVDINMGIGVLLNGLAALMLGETFIGNNTVIRQVIAALIGAITFQIIQSIVLILGLEPSDYRLVTGIIIIFLLSIRKLKGSFA